MTGIQVEMHAGVPPEEWDETVAALGGGIFLSSAWARYQQAIAGGEPRFLLARDGGGASAAAVALIHRSRRPLLSLLLRDLELPSHPAARAGSDEAAAELVRACEELGRRQGCATIRLDSFGAGRSVYRPGGHSYSETERTEFVVDLTAGTEAAWKGIDKKQRERIRQLGRKGVEVTAERSREALATLQALRRSTQRKRAARGQGYDLAADAVLDAALEQELLATGCARVLLARERGEPVAAILFATFAGKAYSIFSGSSEEGYRLGAQSLIFWRAVERFAEEGFTEFNRGGVPRAAEREDHPLHGIYRFKLRLGTTPLVCRSGRKVLSRARAALGGLRDRLRAGGGSRSLAGRGVTRRRRGGRRGDG